MEFEHWSMVAHRQRLTVAANLPSEAVACEGCIVTVYNSINNLLYENIQHELENNKWRK